MKKLLWALVPAMAFLIAAVVQRTASVTSATESTRADDGAAGLPSISAEIWKPEISDISVSDHSLWGAAIGHLKPSPRSDLSELLHALYLFGPGLRFDLGPPILDVVLRPGTCPAPDGLRADLLPTIHGAAFARYNSLLTDAGQEGTEAHRGQALSIMASLGIPLSRPIHPKSGRYGTLRDVFDDMKANFRLQGEVYWDATALAVYQPAGLEWRNEAGEKFSFDGLCEELLGRRPDDSSCAGTHRLIALAVLFRANRERRLLSEWVADRLQAALIDAASHLAEVQSDDGSWDQDWHRGLDGRATLEADAPAAPSRLLATGHHLEWLLMMPSGVRPPRPVLERAAQWLAGYLSQAGSGPPPRGREYCAAVHAARSVLCATGRR